MAFHSLRFSAAAVGAAAMALTLGAPNAYAWTSSHWRSVHTVRHHQRVGYRLSPAHRVVTVHPRRYAYRYAPGPVAGAAMFAGDVVGGAANLVGGILGAGITAAMTPFDCAFGAPWNACPAYGYAASPGYYASIDYGYPGYTYSYPGYAYDYGYSYPGYSYSYGAGWPVASIGFGWGPGYYGNWGDRRWRGGWRGNRWAGWYGNRWGAPRTAVRTSSAWVGTRPGFAFGSRPVVAGGTAWRARRGLATPVGYRRATFASIGAARPAGFGMVGGAHYGRAHFGGAHFAAARFGGAHFAGGSRFGAGARPH